jgi:hypothetical protein
MRYVRLLFILPLLALVACDDDGITVTQVGPASLARVINAAQQPAAAGFTALDLRFVDRVENLPTFQQVPFRGTSGAGYQRVEPGTRHLRLFPTSTDPELAKTRLVDDPSFVMNANERQTLLLTREVTGAHTVTRIMDPATIERAPAGQISIRVLNGWTGAGAIDVYMVRTTSTAVPEDWATNNDGVIQNVAYQTQSGYLNVPVAASDALYMFIVVPDVGGAFAVRPDTPGTAAPAGAVYGDLPGVRIQHSVLTAVVTPGTGATRLFLAIDRTLDPQ